MADPAAYKTEQIVHHSGSPTVVVERDQPNAVTVERRIFFDKGETLSATHRTIVEIRTSLDTFEKPRIVEEMRSEQRQPSVLQYRVVPKIKQIEVPEVHVEYEDTYVEVPVPFELPIIAPRQVPVEQIVQRNIPKPIDVHTKQHFRMPRVQPKYYDVKVPIYVPSYVEVPVPSHFVALKGGESFPEQLELGPAIPHLPSCSMVPDRMGRERYAAEIKMRAPAVPIVSGRLQQGPGRTEAEKLLGDSTAGLPTLHRRGSQGSDLGYSSSALVQGAYPSVEFVAVSTRTSLNDAVPRPTKEKELQLEDDHQLLRKNENEEGLLDEDDQSRMENEASGEETASEYLGNKRVNEFSPSEAGGATTPALSASPALVHAAA